MTTLASNFEAPAFYVMAPAAAPSAGRRRAAGEFSRATAALFGLVAAVAILGLAAAITHAVVPSLSIDDLSPLLGL